MTDLQLTCIQCNEPFTFTEGEQQFFLSKGFQQPKRCLKCRRLKKSQSPQTQVFGKPAQGYPTEKHNPDYYVRDRRRDQDKYDKDNYD